jgi:hypothetical protein
LTGPLQPIKLTSVAVVKHFAAGIYSPATHPCV